MLKIVLTLPGSFLFGMVAPLNLEEFYLMARGQTDILILHMEGSFSIGKIMVEVNGLMVHLLIGMGSTRNL